MEVNTLKRPNQPHDFIFGISLIAKCQIKGQQLKLDSIIKLNIASLPFIVRRWPIHFNTASCLAAFLHMDAM